MIAFQSALFFHASYGATFHCLLFLNVKYVAPSMMMLFGFSSCSNLSLFDCISTITDVRPNRRKHLACEAGRAFSQANKHLKISDSLPGCVFHFEGGEDVGDKMVLLLL